MQSRSGLTRLGGCPDDYVEHLCGVAEIMKVTRRALFVFFAVVLRPPRVRALMDRDGRAFRHSIRCSQPASRRQTAAHRTAFAVALVFEAEADEVPVSYRDPDRLGAPISARDGLVITHLDADGAPVPAAYFDRVLHRQVEQLAGVNRIPCRPTSWCGVSDVALSGVARLQRERHQDRRRRWEAPRTRHRSLSLPDPVPRNVTPATTRSSKSVNCDRPRCCLPWLLGVVALFQ